MHLDYNGENQDIWLQSNVTLRKFIGILGMLLPFLLWFFLWIESGEVEVLRSISHYYYTRLDGVFIISISSLALFLIFYTGYKTIDFILSFIAGIAAFILLIFPTDSFIDFYPNPEFSFSNTVLPQNALREWLHFGAAGVFIFILAIMSIFLFTRSDKSKQQRGLRKIWRNRIYRICGFGMLLAISVIALKALGLIDLDFYKNHKLTFWMEVVALELFGISWLVKAETFLKDRTP